VQHGGVKNMSASTLESKRKIQNDVNKVTRSIYGAVFLIVVTTSGVSLIGFTYSEFVVFAKD
jgi:hypothetical protein